MRPEFRSYDPEGDFMRVRDFLMETYALYGRPFNWLIDRWNFIRFFSVPVHSYYNVRFFSVPARHPEPLRDEVEYWEASIGVWEDCGEIVGVVTPSNEEAGDAFLQIHPDYKHLYGEMVSYAEVRLADVDGGVGYVKLHVQDDDHELIKLAADRGYRKVPTPMPYLVYNTENVPEPKLPEGYIVRSVEEEDDVEKRRRAKSMAFGSNYGPSAWPPASAFRTLQQAPDYREDLDLFIVAPDGEYASFCNIWLDTENGYGNFEPVGTQIWYRGMSLARALLYEGLRRMAEHGVTRSYMDSRNEFYTRIGFERTPYSYSPWIRYFKA